MSASAARANVEVLVPEWRAPPRVRGAFTLRTGGVSAPPYDSLNLGARVGDVVAAVAENRRRVRAQLRLPAEPTWIEQVHGTDVFDLDAAAAYPTAPGPAALEPVAGQEAVPRAVADAILTRRAGHVCVVQVADCLPVLFAARDGSAIAAAHAGWRGLAAGVLEATVGSLAIKPGQLMAWLGPAIGPGYFEVGDEVRGAFLAHDAGAAGAFSANARGRWQCDLVGLARRRLLALGVSVVSGGDWCTYADPTRFFSYRRQGRCGRMAALIWLER